MLYQPDESIRLEVRFEDETVWLTQAQIADLFGTNDGVQVYRTKYYNLDAPSGQGKEAF